MPQALVDEMLSHANELGKNLLGELSEITQKRDEFRQTLNDIGLLAQASEIIGAPKYPTCCGADGSYAIERLLATDLVACASIAVEGLTPPSEKRYWPLPHHDTLTKVVRHSEATTVVLRAIMIGMELELAAFAPHDVIFLDGSLTTPLIYLNQGLGQRQEGPEELGATILAHLSKVSDSYLEILIASRSDKDFVSIPKYTSKREIATCLKLDKYEDRGLLSLILRPGELTRPVPLERPVEGYHLPPIVKHGDQIASALGNSMVTYFRPYGHLPALRLEVPSAVAKNNQRLAKVLEAVLLQCGAPGMLEPYPLYLADRMVKHLSSALPAIRRAATQGVASGWVGDLGEVFMSLNEYRSETGR